MAKSLITHGSHGVGRLGLWLAMIAAAAMAVHVAVEIGSRVFLGKPLTGTIEIVSYFYMVAVTFLPLGNVQARHDQIAADAIANVLPRAIRPITDLLGKLLSIAVGLLLIWASIDMALDKTLISEAVEAAFFDIPVWPSRWMLPIGLGAMTMIMLLQLFEKSSGADPVHEAAHD